ncbi:MAG: MBL fold metallo-hydrolase [Candidatus Thorarchaeota archaeon]|jgi:L-ascorbate metabolism protein UlaG (beta-lactamase superfamily)
MPTTRNTKIGLTLIIAALVVVAPLVLMSYLNQNPPIDSPIDGEDDPVNEPLELPVSSVNVTLLNTAGVMIEANNIRIYIDPFLIPNNYSAFPADMILVTHAHYDHYSAMDIRDVATNDTLVVCPSTMTTQLERYNNSLGVKPGDTFTYRGINVTAFDLYLDDYPSGAQSGHPIESNWTSYIIDIDGFILFHAGDAKYMPEYEEFPVEADVAFLPIYYDPGLGPKNESLLPIIQVIETIKPVVCIPTHWYDEDNDLFMQDYVPLLEDDCEVMNLAFFESHVFSTGN